ncbi:MAG: hypothetical protein KGI54_16345 [Pseudomonadota bacterium]|nr:hypothetical protein [Pseudomonadota bacterium]
MIALGNKIKLNDNEVRLFKQDTGLSTVPDTVEEYNNHLQAAADFWGAEAQNDPAARLLVKLIEADKFTQKPSRTKASGR